MAVPAANSMPMCSEGMPRASTHDGRNGDEAPKAAKKKAPVKKAAAKPAAKRAPAKKAAAKGKSDKK